MIFWWFFTLQDPEWGPGCGVTGIGVDELGEGGTVEGLAEVEGTWVVGSGVGLAVVGFVEAGGGIVVDGGLVVDVVTVVGFGSSVLVVVMGGSGWTLLSLAPPFKSKLLLSLPCSGTTLSDDSTFGWTGICFSAIFSPGWFWDCDNICPKTESNHIYDTVHSRKRKIHKACYDVRARLE